MNIQADIKYEDFYNITIEELYTYVTDILDDFGYNFHNAVRDIDGKQRVEIWKAKKNDIDHSLVWIERVSEGSELSVVIGTDVLRTMNEHAVNKLFFFTNGDVSDDLKDIIDGNEHFIFTPTEIMESLIAVQSKKSEPKQEEKRKNVKVPSGFILIKNYLKSNASSKEKKYVETEKIPVLVETVLKQIETVIAFVDEIEDLDNISKEEQEKIRKMQFKLLPELLQVSFYFFTNHFMYVRNELFEVIKSCIIYLGAIAEYESMSIIEKNKNDMLHALEVLKNVDKELENYKNTLVNNNNKISIKVFVISIILIIFFSIFAFILI